MSPDRKIAHAEHGQADFHVSPAAAMGRMAALLQMEERLRRAGKQELPFIIVNETRLLLPYRQGSLWRGLGGGEILAASGLAVFDKNSPYIQWLNKVFRHMGKVWAEKEAAFEPVPFFAADLPPELQEDWEEWLPPYAVFLPLPLINGAPAEEGEKIFGAMALFSQQAFSQADLRILAHLAGAYGHAASLAFAPKAQKVFSFSRRVKWLIAAAALVALFPARQSVLAPAEVISREPWPVRAPLEGVVERILTAPNAALKEGDPLLKLDTTELETRLAVASKSLAVAKVELRQARQQALTEREAKLRLAYLAGRLEQLEAEKNYVESLIARSEPQSPINGVALVDAPEEWAGKPVSLGQRIMTVADPAKVRLEIFLPMEDYLPQHSGDEVSFFSNANPGSPVEAVVNQVGFQAQETPQAGFSFRIRADFRPDEKNPRLGVRGSAKLYGPRAPLVYNLLRKPLAKLRQWAGF